MKLSSWIDFLWKEKLWWHYLPKIKRKIVNLTFKQLAEVDCKIVKFYFFFALWLASQALFRSQVSCYKTFWWKLTIAVSQNIIFEECFWEQIDATCSFNKVSRSILKTVNIFCFFFFFFVSFSARRLKKNFFFLLVKLNLLSFFNFALLRESWLFLRHFKCWEKNKKNPLERKKHFHSGKLGWNKEVGKTFVFFGS